MKRRIWEERECFDMDSYRTALILKKQLFSMAAME